MTSTLFTERDLAGMREAQDGYLPDTCVLQSCTTAADSYGEMIETWTDGEAIPCGFNPSGSREIRQRDKTVLEADALLRVALDVEIDEQMRVKITRRHGERLSTALVYHVEGDAQIGPSAKTLRLRRVEV